MRTEVALIVTGLAIGILHATVLDVLENRESRDPDKDVHDASTPMLDNVGSTPRAVSVSRSSAFRGRVKAGTEDSAPWRSADLGTDLAVDPPGMDGDSVHAALHERIAQAQAIGGDASANGTRHSNVTITEKVITGGPQSASMMLLHSDSAGGEDNDHYHLVGKKRSIDEDLVVVGNKTSLVHHTTTSAMWLPCSMVHLSGFEAHPHLNQRFFKHRLDDVQGRAPYYSQDENWIAFWCSSLVKWRIAPLSYIDALRQGECWSFASSGNGTRFIDSTGWHEATEQGDWLAVEISMHVRDSTDEEWLPLGEATKCW